MSLVYSNLIASALNNKNKALQDIVGSVKGGLSLLSSNKAEDEKKRYEDYLKNNGMLSSFKKGGLGLKENYNSMLLDNDKSVYDIQNNYDSYVDPSMAGSVFDKFMKTRSNIAKMKNNELLNQNNGLLNEQKNTILGYIDNVGDKNNDGIADINDLNSVERESILAKGSIMPELQSELLNTAYSNKNKSLLYEKNRNDKLEDSEKLIDYRTDANIKKQKQLLDSRTTKQSTLEKLKILNAIKSLELEKSNLLNTINTTIDDSQKESATKQLNTISLLEDEYRGMLGGKEEALKRNNNTANNMPVLNKSIPASSETTNQPTQQTKKQFVPTKNNIERIKRFDAKTTKNFLDNYSLSDRDIQLFSQENPEFKKAVISNVFKSNKDKNIKDVVGNIGYVFGKEAPKVEMYAEKYDKYKNMNDSLYAFASNKNAEELKKYGLPVDVNANIDFNKVIEDKISGLDYAIKNRGVTDSAFDTEPSIRENDKYYSPVVLRDIEKTKLDKLYSAGDIDKKQYNYAIKKLDDKIGEAYFSAPKTYNDKQGAFETITNIFKNLTELKYSGNSKERMYADSMENALAQFGEELRSQVNPESELIDNKMTTPFFTSNEDRIEYATNPKVINLAKEALKEYYNDPSLDISDEAVLDTIYNGVSSNKDIPSPGELISGESGEDLSINKTESQGKLLSYIISYIVEKSK